MIGLAILMALLIVADFFLLKIYLKILKGKKLYLLLLLKVIINIIGYMLLTWKCPGTFYGYFMMCFISLLSLISIEDACSMTIDKWLSWVLLVIGILTSFVVPSGGFWKIIIFSGVIALVLYLFSVKSNEAIGKGDIVCITAATLCFSFNNVFSLMIYTLLASLIFGIVQLILKKTDAKQGMPFAPFLVLGILLTLYFL